MTARSYTLAFGIVAAACADSSGAAPAPAARGPQPALVELARVTGDDVTSGWVFLGHVRAAMAADIAAAASGHVLAVTVREGDPVERGQRLVRLDGAEVSARLSAAKARLAGIDTELALADKQFARVRGLGFPTVSEPEKERYQQAVDGLRAQRATEAAELRRLQVEWRRHTVSAPFAGTVSARQVDPGAWVGVGQPLVSLVSTDALEIHVDVLAELGRQLTTGGAAELIGPGDARQSAVVRGVVPAVDRETGTMKVRLEPQARARWLIAGMPIDVEFEMTASASGVAVPPDAIVRGPVGARVVKFVDGEAVYIAVEILASGKHKVLVRGDGLAVGDQVVVRGNARLRPGQPLRVRDQTTPRGGASAGAG